MSQVMRARAFSSDREQGASHLIVTLLLLLSVVSSFVMLGYQYLSGSGGTHDKAPSFVSAAQRTPDSSSTLSDPLQSPDRSAAFKTVTVNPDPVDAELTLTKQAPRPEPIRPEIRDTEQAAAVSAPSVREAGHEKKPEAIIVQDIGFERSEQGSESVHIRSSGPFTPEVTVLKGRNPYGSDLRMVLDIHRVAPMKNKASTLHVKGDLVRRIRTLFHPDSKKLRVVLDLNTSKTFEKEMGFNSDDNRFTLILKSTETQTAGTRPDTVKPVPEPVRPAEPVKSVESAEPVRPVKVKKEMKKEPGRTLIDKVAVRKTKTGGEALLISSDSYFEPVVFGLEGSNPYGPELRMVIDIPRSGWKDKPVIRRAVNGDIIKRIRTFLDQGTGKLRVVLDLGASDGYEVDQVFYKDLNIYALSLTRQGEEERTGTVTASVDPAEKNAPEFEVIRVSLKSAEPRRESLSKDHEEGVGSIPIRDSVPQTLLPAGSETSLEERPDASADIKDDSGDGRRLRRTPGNLSDQDIAALLRRYNFYSTCSGYNSEFCNSGGSFENHFMDNGDGTVSDHTTGLMWQKGGSPEPMTWDRAREYVEALNHQGFAGYADWRLPTIEELASLMENSWREGELYLEPVFKRDQRECWSSDLKGLGRAWRANFHLGHTMDSPVDFEMWARAVRSQPVLKVDLRKPDHGNQLLHTAGVENVQKSSHGPEEVNTGF